MSSARPYTWTRSDGTVGRAWRARWTKADGKPTERRGFDRERDALAYAADREAEARHGVKLGEVVPTGRTTLEVWSQVWLDGLNVRSNTRTNYTYSLKRILPSFGSRTLESLRPSELKSWRRALGEQYAASTANGTVNVLGMMLRAAVEDGLLTRSPMPSGRGRTLVRVVDPDELLTLQQVGQWGHAMPEVACEMPLVAALTGMRQGELLGLRLPSVDFLRRQARVVEQLLEPNTGHSKEYGPPKTAAGIRTVPLPALAAEALARHLERQPAVPGEPIFRNARGGRWARSSFRDAWKAGHAGAGLPPWATWHSLRDVYASALIRQQVDIRTVMTLMGHTSSQETIVTYGRLWGDAHDVARQSLDRLWDGQVVGTSAEQ